ncbi:inducible alternative oxidase 2 [Tieghemiomyces parasiticus]|uniref:Alternative oxidase n=1 Tax=Tieghemiomyces parasiticus TaxID=78921 RepID=A0A9W8DM33_9FUNG|nr:inducible alternative oxidase 2 [Tieghemiomyces parasiticus]
MNTFTCIHLLRPAANRTQLTHAAAVGRGFSRLATAGHLRPAMGLGALHTARAFSLFSRNAAADSKATPYGQQQRPTEDPPSLRQHKERLRAEQDQAQSQAEVLQFGYKHHLNVDTTRSPGIEMPPELQHSNIPMPIRDDFLADRPLKTADLEHLEIYPTSHREPNDWADRIALTTVKLLRLPTDVFFRRKYVHRAVMLETVAAVPGMVGAMLRHLRSLRRLRHDGGWISHLLHEAENERMHLMTWMRVCQPSWFDRLLVILVQGFFFNAFTTLYMVSPRTAHRVVGYLEEEAVISYTAFLKEIDAGRIENVPAPEIAVQYWNLDPKTATLRDVVLAVRADEALHRDTNHHFADRLITQKEDLHETLRTADWRRAHERTPKVTADAADIFPKSAATTSRQ